MIVFGLVILQIVDVLLIPSVTVIAFSGIAAAILAFGKSFDAALAEIVRRPTAAAVTTDFSIVFLLCYPRTVQ